MTWSLIITMTSGLVFVPYQGISQDVCQQFANAAVPKPHIVALVEYPRMKSAVCIKAPADIAPTPFFSPPTILDEFTPEGHRV